jgi:hypothetical protein
LCAPGRATHPRCTTRHERRRRRAIVRDVPSHRIVWAPSIDPLVPLASRVVHSVRRSRRNRGRRGCPLWSPPCTVVECLPDQVLSVNGPLVSMHSSPRPRQAGNAAGLTGIGGAAPPPWPGTQLRDPLSLQGLKCMARAWL